MTLDTKLDIINNPKWDKKEAYDCWNTYHTKFMDKYGGALHTAMMQGNVGQYIEKEVRTFARYAQMWAYRRNITPRTYVEFKPKVTL